MPHHAIRKYLPTCPRKCNDLARTLVCSKSPHPYTPPCVAQARLMSNRAATVSLAPPPACEVCSEAKLMNSCSTSERRKKDMIARLASTMLPIYIKNGPKMLRDATSGFESIEFHRHVMTKHNTTKHPAVCKS
jgi:hypothetical protein